MQRLLFIFSILLFSGLLSAQCLQLQSCPSGAVDACDLTPNNANLWNETYWWAPGYQITDMPEGPVDLCFSASDTCQGANLDIRYVLFLDLDGDSIRETIIKSITPPPANQVPYNNAGSGGSPRAFDERPVLPGQKYRFAIEQTGTPGNRTACFRWNTGDAPGTYVVPELPYGTHSIRWIVENGLGQADSCEYLFNVKDCKKPTVVCYNGLTINIMPTGLISMWASDFLQYTEDNATPTNLLDYAIRKSGTGTGFPLDSIGNPNHGVTFDCSELGTQFVEIWSRDLAGNIDFCETFVIVQDANDACGNTTVHLDLSLCANQWCTGAPVTDIQWEIPINLAAVLLNDLGSFDSDGCLQVDSTVNISPMNNYLIYPKKDDDPLNGLDVLDLIRINKHILGLEPLTAYAQIAADANNSNSLTTFDIIEIRKLLTGIYQSFPNNTSWRFVPTDYVFPNPNNAFQGNFPTNVTAATQQDTLSVSASFQAIKTGDVDCSAIPGISGGASGNRQPLWLTAPDRVLQAGETVDLPVSLAVAGQWLGFQIGLRFDPELLTATIRAPENIPNWDEYTVAQPHPGRLNLLWFDTEPLSLQADAPLFFLRLTARQPVRLSDAFSLTPDGLRAHAFRGENETHPLQLRFSAPIAPELAISEPWPNPTKGETTFSLTLTESADAQLRIWDVQGHQTWMGDYALEAGSRQLTVPGTAFPASGVYFWQMCVGRIVKTGKLVR